MMKPKVKATLAGVAGFLLLLCFQNFSYPSADLATCPRGTLKGPVIISTSVQLANRDCVIDGDLTVTNNAIFRINYNGVKNNKFVVRGNLTVEDNAQLQVIGRAEKEDLFVIANDHNMHRTIKATGSAQIVFNQIEFRTQENVNLSKGSIGMSYDGEDNSVLYINKSKLNVVSAWLLAYIHGKSRLYVVDSQGLPTENYIKDYSTVKIKGPTTQTGVWLDAAGVKGSMRLPDVRQPYSWRIGRNNGLAVGWYLEVENAQPGLAVEIRQDTKLEITGRGKPDPGELKIGYYIEDASEQLVGLNSGLQNRKISERLKLNNVQLGPIAWAVYAGSNSVVNIKNSKINEIGISGPNTRVSVENSILQLALLGVMAPGSRLDIANSKIWNQAIETEADAQVTINGSQIFGSLFHAKSPQSKITISNSAFYRNPANCTGANMVNIQTGIPNCNPFRPPGPPAKMGTGTVKCDNVKGCRF